MSLKLKEVYIVQKSAVNWPCCTTKSEWDRTKQTRYLYPKTLWYLPAVVEVDPFLSFLSWYAQLFAGASPEICEHQIRVALETFSQVLNLELHLGRWASSCNKPKFTFERLPNTISINNARTRWKSFSNVKLMSEINNILPTKIRAIFKNWDIY